jgi:hypothetical protein
MNSWHALGGDGPMLFSVKLGSVSLCVLEQARVDNSNVGAS